MPLNSAAVAAHLRADARSVGRAGGMPSITKVRRFAEPPTKTLDPDELFLIGLYDGLLGREPDGEGFTNNLAALRQGLPRTAMHEAMNVSDEALKHRGTQDSVVPDDSALDAFVLRGLHLVTLGVPSAPEQLSAEVARWRSGVPLGVIAYEMAPSGARPWELLLVDELLRGTPAENDAAAVDRALVRLNHREAPESILASLVPGRGPVARARRHRRARRAEMYATFALLQAAQNARVEGTSRPVPGDDDPVVRLGELASRQDRRLGSIETTLAKIGQDTAAAATWRDEVSVVEVDGLLFGVPAREWRLAAYLEHRGHPEPGLAGILTTYLKPGGRFIDVGANIGLYTVAAAAVVGPTGSVVAVEPTPTTVEMLRENVQLNGFLESDIVRVVEGAAGARRGRAKLAVYAHDSGHNTLYAKDARDASVEVDVVPLDEVVERGSTVDVVKIDVEGGELAVLRGMQRIVDENPHIVVFAELADIHLRRAGTSAQRFLDTVVELGWEWDIFETVSGASATTETDVPLSVFLRRAAASPAASTPVDREAQ
ncbi:FkbM family methyltransferase [Oerskovia paurometabola]|uniref:FkbM family methyltransferase n=1 Tax=Oerskovia paurometabola TaxID=162170 RepID=UPI003423912A